MKEAAQSKYCNIIWCANRKYPDTMKTRTGQKRMRFIMWSVLAF